MSSLKRPTVYRNYPAAFLPSMQKILNQLEGNIALSAFEP